MFHEMYQYRSYHSGVKLQYANGELQSDISKDIPRSTKQRWKAKTIHSFWSHYTLKENDSLSLQAKLQRLKRENERLKVQIKTLFYLISIYKDLTALSPIKSIQVLKVRKGTEILMRHCKENGLEKTMWRYLPFSLKQWKAWSGQKHCINSLPGYCRKQNPQQLSLSEQEIIKIECANKDYENWPLNSIYYQLLRDLKIHCSISTFYMYCRLMNITRIRVKNPKQYTPYRADEPLKVLHQDITIFKTMNGVRHYIYVIRDNFSRAYMPKPILTKDNEVSRVETSNSMIFMTG